MTMATAAPERFDIGRVLSAGFGIVSRQAVTLVVLVAIFGFLPAAATFWLTTNILPAPTPGAPPALPALLQRTAIVELIAIAVGGFGWILQGAVATAALGDLGGRPLGVGAVLARIGPRAPMVYVVGVVATLGILIGTLALVVPGVLLALAWSLGGIVAMVENTGFGSFRRSAELTRGNRLSLFVILLIWGVVGVVAGLVARIIGGVALYAPGATAGVPLWMTLGVQPLATAVVQVFSTATMAAAYVELRGVKEGVPPSGLAAIFD